MILKYRISIFSENPDQLADFYINLFSPISYFKVEDIGNYGYSISLNKDYKLWIGKHSEITGTNMDSKRLMLCLYVDNIHSYMYKIKSYNKAQIVQDTIIVCKGIVGEERYMASFYDPDGNCIQMMQIL